MLPPFYQALTNAFIAPILMFVMLVIRDTTTTYGWFEILMIGAVTLTFLLA